jgi:hypothetical protein
VVADERAASRQAREERGLLCGPRETLAKGDRRRNVLPIEMLLSLVIHHAPLLSACLSCPASALPPDFPTPGPVHSARKFSAVLLLRTRREEEVRGEKASGGSRRAGQRERGRGREVDRAKKLTALHRRRALHRKEEGKSVLTHTVSAETTRCKFAHQRMLVSSVCGRVKTASLKGCGQ